MKHSAPIPPLRCIALPFAGGTRHSYRPLESALPATIRLEPLELPGHGTRMGEPLTSDLEALADDAFGQIRGRVSEAPYVLFGHSMGAALAWLVARRIAAAALPRPQRLIVSAARAPSVDRDEGYHRLDDPRFVETLRRLGGCPPELLEHPELLELFLPILRSDFRATETYAYEPEPRVTVPIAALRGTRDEVTEDEVAAWSRETTEAFSMHSLEGGHFFIFEQPAAVAHVLSTLASAETG